MKTLLKNAYVLLGHEIKFTNLIIEDDTISYIGDNPEVTDTVRDMHGCLLMPGLVNAHAHGPMTLLRGLGTGLALQDWLDKAIYPIEAKLVPDDIYVGEKWAIIEMLASGTTMVAEMYDFPYRTADALLESGMKGTITRVGLAFSDQEEFPPHRFDECIELVKNFKDPANRVRADLSIHAEYSTNENFVRRIAEANKELGVGVHIHVSETRREAEECRTRHHGLSPIQYFNECGLLDQRVYAAHSIWLGADDYKLIKEKNVSLVHNPTSNLKLGSGVIATRKILAYGINLALGTDGVASNNNLNMFEEMHIAAILSNGFRLDPKSVTPEQVIDMATINGAKALGFFDTGVLEIGKKADIIAVSLDKPHMYPALEILPLLVYSAQASDVVMTMVDGKILYDHGEYTTIDVDKTKFEMEKVLKRLY